MEKYFKRKSDSLVSKGKMEESAKKRSVEINFAELPTDPRKRIQISEYDPNIRDQVRRAYIQKGPCQPKNHDFSFTKIGQAQRRFNSAWFDEYRNWLEYSITKDAAFCLCCYLFKQSIGDLQGGGDSFISEGFSNWKEKGKLRKHVGGPNSIHNQALKNCEALMNQNQHIETIISKQSKQARIDYRTHLYASVVCTRFLLQQGLPFRGHDESEDSRNKGNFLELLQFLANHNNEVKAVTLQNAPDNHKSTSPEIQKEITHVVAVETMNAIIKDIGNALYSIIVDESRDISMKEQMAIVLHYVDQNGCVIERFVGIEHVASTTALSLKAAIDRFFSRHGLSMSRLRGQGYDGASNMQGEFNGLKTLIMKENLCAFYIHCFAHQLQLALVAVAKKGIHIASFFSLVNNVVNIIKASAKRSDTLQDIQAIKNVEALQSGEISSGRGLNQNTTLKRPVDIRWGSHYSTLMSLILIFSSTVEVLEKVADDGSNHEQRCEAYSLLEFMQSFDFIFSLHLMKNILGVTNDLSQALQRKDQDIVNSMALVRVCKRRFQTMRDNEWDSFYDQVTSFCAKQKIDIPDMDSIFKSRGRSRRKTQEITNLHHFRVDIFYSVIDLQLQELNERFNEVNTELLLCVTCLSPNDLFSTFDKEKLIQLAKYYPKDFSEIDIMTLEDQLGTYIIDMCSSEKFIDLKGISELAQKMVQTRKDEVYPLVYKLLTLALILPIATASVERVFSSMNIVKNELRNRIGDEWMNDSLLVYTEKEISNHIDNEAIIQRFQGMKSR